MIRIESHPDYHEIEAAHAKLSTQGQKNQQLINDKLQKSINVTVDKRKKFDTLKQQNETTANIIDSYFRELTSELSTTERSLAFARDNNFQHKADVFLTQLELIEMRLQAETEGGVEYFEIYPSGNRWHVSETTSQESLADFATQEEAEAYAVKLRRRFRLLTLLSIL